MLPKSIENDDGVDVIPLLKSPVTSSPASFFITMEPSTKDTPEGNSSDTTTLPKGCFASLTLIVHVSVLLSNVTFDTLVFDSKGERVIETLSTPPPIGTSSFFRIALFSNSFTAT